MITQMNEEIFSTNLSKAVDKIKEARGISSDIVKFVIEPVEEHGKILDDYPATRLNLSFNQ
ncbi:hypothetical protein [Paenibacillus sp. 22594]|uniref:hypothetical protein n=1 Tax=Paenibacillus sp. 22594 TaxID=3453947 RepID=UPI003F874DF6